MSVRTCLKAKVKANKISKDRARELLTKYDNRVAQLEAFDIRHRVLCNRGGKGRPVQELIDEMKPSATVFIDDLSVHHESVATHAPDVWRLHMIAEPRLAATTPPAPHAHARIAAPCDTTTAVRHPVRATLATASS